MHVLFKQRNIGQQWGVFVQTSSQLAIFVSALNLLLLAATAYNTTLREWLERCGVSITFLQFMCIITVLLIIAAVLVYKFALPSLFSFVNDQAYIHDNPIRNDIEQLQKTLNKDMEEIKDRLKELENRKEQHD